MKLTPTLMAMLDECAAVCSMLKPSRRRFLMTVVAVVAAAVVSVPVAPWAYASEDPFDPREVATWSAPMVSSAPSATNQINNQTLRLIAHVSIGGDRVRIKLSNRYGTAPLLIGAAQVGLRAATGGSDIVAGSSEPLTFSGTASFAIPTGAELMSDWIDFTVPALADLAVDLYIPGDTGTVGTGSPITGFNGAMQTNYVSDDRQSRRRDALPSCVDPSAMAIPVRDRHAGFVCDRNDRHVRRLDHARVALDQ